MGLHAIPGARGNVVLLTLFSHLLLLLLLLHDNTLLVLLVLLLLVVVLLRVLLRVLLLVLLLLVLLVQLALLVLLVLHQRDLLRAFGCHLLPLNLVESFQFDHVLFAELLCTVMEWLLLCIACLRCIQ